MRSLGWILVGVLIVVAAGVAVWTLQAPPRRNAIIFVADGLRYGIVTPDTAPALVAVQREGVDFRNSHAMYPTVTTPNASAIATGRRLGDTGDFGNTVFLGVPALAASYGQPIANFEDDPSLGDANARFGGDYLGHATLLAAARAKGFSTAAIGKLGPTAIQDVAARDGKTTIVIDDSTGYPEGIPLSDEIRVAIKAAGLPTIAPDRGLNADPGAYNMPGVHVPNKDQQDWFTAIATKVLLPRFKQANKPFVLVFWSRDPDGTQHNEGDSLNRLTPGINGATSMAAIKNASNDLQQLRDTLKALGLDKTTDIVVTADHGFSTIAKASATSEAARRRYNDVPPGFLPAGFLTIDLAKALGMPFYEPGGIDIFMKQGFHPKSGSTIIGADRLHPDIVVGANGGSDLLWLPKADKALAARIVQFLTTQDYTAAIFVDDALGPVPGALPTSAIELNGAARTPRPSIVVSFRSFSTGCPRPELCVAEVADTPYQQGEGIHGAFSRADTRNFMALVGPDFKAGYTDDAPVSNADWAPTLSKALGLPFDAGGLSGRVMTEVFKGGAEVAGERAIVRSTPAANGFVTVLQMQRAGAKPYFDAAGAPGRTFGAP